MRNSEIMVQTTNIQWRSQHKSWIFEKMNKQQILKMLIKKNEKGIDYQYQQKVSFHES